MGINEGLIIFIEGQKLMDGVGIRMNLNFLIQETEFEYF